MSDVSIETSIESEPSSDAAARRKRDRARLRRIGVRHAAAALAAITLWGAADIWAAETGWLLAETVALLNALFAGTVIAYLAHEWGHFAGARISGAISPVLKTPESFFMFKFKDELNTESQFIAMSIGGSVANWSLVVAIFLFLPFDTWSQAMLLATVTAIAVSVAVFEFPIINRVSYGAPTKETVAQRQRESGLTPRYIGIFVGAIVWLIAI